MNYSEASSLNFCSKCQFITKGNEMKYSIWEVLCIDCKLKAAKLSKLNGNSSVKKNKINQVDLTGCQIFRTCIFCDKVLMNSTAARLHKKFCK